LEKETCFDSRRRLTLFLQTEMHPDSNGMVDRLPAGFHYSVVDAGDGDSDPKTPLETGE
jgi:hypothetical protein